MNCVSQNIPTFYKTSNKALKGFHLEFCRDIPFYFYRLFMKPSFKRRQSYNLIQHFSSIYGLGRQNSLRICDDLGFCPSSLYAHCSAADHDRMFFYMKKYFYTENLYRNIVKKDIDRYIEISCFRGIRHANGLPCRGQRTHGNAQTSRKYGRNKIFKNVTSQKKKALKIQKSKMLKNQKSKKHR